MFMNMLFECRLLSGKRIAVFLYLVVKGPEIFKIFSTKHDAHVLAHIRITLQGALKISDQALLMLDTERNEILDLSEVLMDRLEENCCKIEYSLFNDRHNTN